MSRTLAHALFWVAAAACVSAELAILRAALAAPQTQPSDAHVPRPSRVGEIVWVIIPAVALGALLWFTWRVLP
jgi:hypothetical protein